MPNISRLKDWFKNFAKSSDKNICLSILWITIIVMVYFYFGIHQFFSSTFVDVQKMDYFKYIYHNFSSLVLFFVFGIFFVKVILRGKLSDFGLSFGDYKWGLKFCLIATIVVPIMAFTASFDESMRYTYPLYKAMGKEPFEYIVLYYISYVGYYIGWEFLFRGIGLFSMDKKMGALASILITTMVSALIHSSIASFGKPMMESFSAILGGFIFGYVAYRSKSIWYSFYAHFLLGFLTDVFIMINPK